MRLRYGVLCAALAAGWSVAHADDPGSRGELFEAAALVDSYDFAAVRDRDKRLIIDTERAAGNLAILEHVLETGANTILWRNCGGATMRYQSVEERYPLVESPLDKRRIPSDRQVYGWMRYYESEPDILRFAMEECHKRGLGAGVHWPYEETHGAGWTFGGWNLEHPQFWGMTRGGQPWPGRCSVAYPEVVAHKLRLVDELVERGMEHLFIDTFRVGGWSPAYEYVAPEVRRWQERYGSEPLPGARDPRWCELVAETQHEYFVKLKRHLEQGGRPARLMLGVAWIKGGSLEVEHDDMLLARGIDWRRAVREGIVDTVVVYDVEWDGKRPFESTREIYREVVEFCRGRCEVLFPMSMYSFTNKGIPAYRKATGLTLEQVVEELVRITWEEGGDGFNMECVDYNNYPAGVRAKLSELMAGRYKYKNKGESKSEKKSD